MLIKVASLNFSGINVSPFEYHDGSQQKTLVNSCFRRLLDNYHSENSKHYGNIAKIDLLFQKNRYTILYRTNVGILRGKLVSKEQFETIWDLIFQQNEENMKSVSLQDPDVEMLKTFDRMIYEAFLQYVYGKVDWAQIKNYDPQMYEQELKKWHSKCYLQLDLKTRFVKEYLAKRDLDILFLQEAEIEYISKSLPDGYTYTHSSKSMIVLKKNLFEKDVAAPSFSLKYGDALNFNKDSTFIKLKDFLLISAHLSSKKIKTEQAEQLKKTLQDILAQQPHLKIIMGIDANQYLQQIQSFSIFPTTKMDCTTRKRRTDMQLQFQKAGLVVQDVKDHIVTNLKMVQTNVETIRCQNIGEEYLPNEHHPFDHFAVYSHIVDDHPCHLEHLAPPVKQQKRVDAKSVSTCNSTKKSGTMHKSKKSDEVATPSIVISYCEEVPKNQSTLKNKNHELRHSHDFSRSSKNSRNSHTSKSPITNLLEPPCMTTLKFRKSSFAAQQIKENKQKGNHLKPQTLVFKFRESNRSKSVQKSSDKPKHIKPPSLYFPLSSSQREENSMCQTTISPAQNKKSCKKYSKV